MATAPKHEVIENMSEYITAVETKFCDSARDGHLVIGVSGGSAVEVTAAALERLYKGGQVKKVDIFFCDERVVPDDDKESIHGAYLKKSSQMNEFCKFHIPEIALSDAAVIASDYERKIRSFFKATDNIPKFDCLLLGMGDDGHTCSLFPGHDALAESAKLVTSVTDSPKPPPVRVTMTYPLLNNAHQVLFLVRGASKAPTVKQILKSEAGSHQLPAAKVQTGTNPVVWLLDNAAASLL